MKHDNLEKYIRENRDAFDVFEPDDKIWNRIVKPVPRPVRITWNKVLMRVAAVVVIFIASYFAHDFIEGDQKNSPLVIQGNQTVGLENIKELMEAEVFYSSQINGAKEEIIQASGNDKALLQDINFDLIELDNVFKELKSDLNDDSDNAEVVEAMIQNYRLKLSILEEILGQLKKSKHEETNETQSHEI